MVGEILYTCEFCKRPLKTERGFEKHNCDAKKREKQFLSIEGQMAWHYYKTWIKSKYVSSPLKPATFKSSNYFKAFNKFALFVKKTKIPDIPSFVNLMVKMNIAPYRWTNDEVYGSYLSHITKNLSIYDLEKITISTLFDVAEAAETDISEVFSVLTPNEVIQLLHQRRLFPWLLLKSKKFANFVINDTTVEERIIMENLINPDYWNKRFKNHPKEVALVKQYISELGL